MKSNLICSDYEGVVQLWDVSQQSETMTFEEHAKRVWSVDFSQVSTNADFLMQHNAASCLHSPFWLIAYFLTTAADVVSYQALLCAVLDPHCTKAGMLGLSCCT